MKQPGALYTNHLHYKGKGNKERKKKKIILDGDRVQGGN